MSKDKQIDKVTNARSQYTLAYKLEAVRLVEGGQSVPTTAKILGIPCN
jgi:transposase